MELPNGKKYVVFSVAKYRVMGLLHKKSFNNLRIQVSQVMAHPYGMLESNSDA